MMDAFYRGIGAGLFKALVGFPVAFLIIQGAVWFGVFEWAALPVPTLRQAIVIAAAIVFLS